jgi:phage terminase large subunit GpA-like protein
VIDSGGQHTEQVYKFTHARTRGIRVRSGAGERRVLVFSIKGAAGAREIVGRPSYSERYKVKLYVVGVDTAKDVVFSRMRVRVAGPGFMHIPGGVSCGAACEHHRVDMEYLEQLTGERAVRRWRKGRGWQREWEKTRERNEALDLEVYALAALHILGGAMLKAIPERADAWAKKVEGEEVGSVTAKGTAQGGQARRKRGAGWVGGWKR